MSLKLRCQQGFTTVTLMGVLAVGGLLVAAGFAAVDGDISLAREDQDYKQSYGAAEGGLQWYLNRLGQDNNFYVRCTSVPPPNATESAPVNQKWDGVGSDPRIWRKLPGEEAEYAVELVPAPGFPGCVQNNQYSMIDPNGNLTIRVTGRSLGEYRTVLATLRRANFIDFIYFTDFETLDPGAYATPDDTADATAQCSTYRASRTSFCTEIQFTATDVINGPFHTNDSLRICGGATFGRSTRDAIEIVGTPAWENGGCAASPNVVGTLVNPASVLALPPSNAAIEGVVQPAYKFKGRTHIALNGANMTVTTGYDVGVVTTTTMPLPSNGVIYVDNSNTGSCAAGGYVREQRYTGTGRGSPTSCGNAWISGTYSNDLTIAADNDVIIEGEHDAHRRRRAARADRQQLRARLPPGRSRRHRRQRSGRLREHRLGRRARGARGDPVAQALVHPRQLVLRAAHRRPDGGRRDRPEVPWTGRHRQRRHDHHRLPQELHLQRPAALPRAAVLPRPGAGLLADLARDRAGAGHQALAAQARRKSRSSAATSPGALTVPPCPWPSSGVHLRARQRGGVGRGRAPRPGGALGAEQHQAGQLEALELQARQSELALGTQLARDGG